MRETVVWKEKQINILILVATCKKTAINCIKNNKKYMLLQFHMESITLYSHIRFVLLTWVVDQQQNLWIKDHRALLPFLEFQAKYIFVWNLKLHYYWEEHKSYLQGVPFLTVAQKGHTWKLKILLQIKNSTCKLKILPAN